MNRKALKLSALLLAALSVAAFSGCQEKGSPAPSASSSTQSSISEEEKTFDPALVGSWERTVGDTRLTYTFAADGNLDVLKEELDNPYGNGQYQTTADHHKCYTVGNELHYEKEAGSIETVHTYSVSGNQLTIKDRSTKIDMVYTKK